MSPSSGRREIYNNSTHDANKVNFAISLGPKKTTNCTAISKATLFQMFAEFPFPSHLVKRQD